MDNLYYQFGGNSGYKIHLPVVPDANDQLTKQIAEYLDSLYGTTEADRFDFIKNCDGTEECYSKYFKIGKCSDAMGEGKGMTIYGKESTADEMKKLAQDIEAKFGKDILAVKTKHNIGFPTPDTQLTSVVTGRFNGRVQRGKGTSARPVCGFKVGDSGYNHNGNPSGAPTALEYKNIKGQLCDSNLDVLNWKSLSDIDKKFCWGTSTMEAIDHFGELFTGKIENGKVPQFIMDGLPKEYLQHYNLTEKDIVLRINKGTKLFLANMLEDMVNTPNSQAFRKVQWMSTLDPKLIDEAKQLLAQYEPQTVQKLEQMLPQLEQKCPALAVLKQTTPFAQMKITPVQPSGNPVTNPVNLNNPNPVKPSNPNPVHTSNPVTPNPIQTSIPTGTSNPVTPNPQPKPTSNVGGNSVKANWFEQLGTKGKVGVVVGGAALVAGIIYALSSNKNKPNTEEPQKSVLETQLMAQNQTTNLNQQPYNNYYGYYNNPYQTYSMNGFMRI